ncbi:MAG: thioredoxin family protein, partial [Pseudomonadales bacterium]
RSFMSRLVAAVFALSLAAASWAVEKEPFSNERFTELQSQGELILVDVFATWCPTCALQQKILANYAEAHPEVNLHVLVVDFDNDREYVRQLRAPRQSTLFLYKGSEQLWFSVAETREEVVFAAINQGAKHR